MRIRQNDERRPVFDYFLDFSIPQLDILLHTEIECHHKNDLKQTEN